MKKIIYGVAAAAVALLSACETLAPQENVSEIVSSVTSEKVVLTATIGNDDTKTYLEWDGNVFKTRWAEGDQIYLFDADVSYENAEEAMSQFNIISGVGESTAQFELARGYMPENYVAFYGSCGLLDNGDWSFWINHNQSARSDSHEQSIDDDCFPMVAVGSGTDLRFKNLCSVLKLNITGDGEVLDAISISSKDEGVFLSGYSHLNLEGTRPSYWFSDEYYWLSHYNDVLFDPEDDVVLSSEPYECYIVLASQTYPSGLSIKIAADNGFMEVETEDNLVLSQSELREIPALKFETEVSYENAWKIEFPNSGAIPIVLEEEGEYLVAKNVALGHSPFHVVDPASNGYCWSTDYGGWTEQFTNTCAKLEKGDDMIYISHEGNYDLYLDWENLHLFIMNSGTVPEDLPTKENVVCQDYYMLKSLSDETLVKVYGRVTAVYGRGFMLSLNGYGDDILVYTYDSYIDQKNKLADVEVGLGVELYAKKVIYNGLPELKDVEWSFICGPSNFGRTYYPTNISEQLDSYSPYGYSYVSLCGELYTSGSYYNLRVDGGGEKEGSISFPVQDLSEYVGKRVYVEGFCLGLSGRYVNIMLTKIGYPDTDGGTEDVLPDEDIVISSR